MLALGALFASLAVTAYAIAVAMRVPPPELDDGEVGDKLLWDTALIAAVPMGLLWVVCLAGPAPVLRLFAAGCGVVLSQIAWVLRAPRPGRDDRGGGGGDGGREPLLPPPGGDGIDWQALERAVEATSREEKELISV